MIGRRLALLVAAGAAVWSVTAEAQPYPARPVTIVVPYAAGGVFDTMARIIGERMGEVLGRSVIVENVTGEAPRAVVARANTADAGASDCAGAGYRGLRCRDLDGFLPAERRAEGHCGHAERGNPCRNGYACNQVPV